MKNIADVRITKVTIKNFKNVKNGVLTLTNKKDRYQSSILGLYGQNGSGKTALIDSLELLDYALSGKEISLSFCNYINVDSDYASFEFVFDVVSKVGKYEAIYEFKIAKQLDALKQDNSDESSSYRTKIFDEVLSASFENEIVKIRKGAVIDTRTDKVFNPVSKYELLIGKNKKDEEELMFVKRLTMMNSKSFIFSPALTNILSSRAQYGIDSGNYNLFILATLSNILSMFAKTELFVLGTRNSGLLSLDALPFTYSKQLKDLTRLKECIIPIDEPVILPKDIYFLVEKSIEAMNVVLQQLVPGLIIKVKNLGNAVRDDGDVGIMSQLVSCKNSKEIPLKNESEGIKKIISILHLLIAVYNQPSVTVAIDELDSGIFEYLLGEIVKIIAEKGKGQLIFTSHNLRPLETLANNLIAFTTTDSSNRYIRMVNIKGHNNLRDCYYRNIILKNGNEELYQLTNNAEIANAFREAGELYEE